MKAPYKGELSTYPLPLILLGLHRDEETGVLSVMTPQFTKRIYFKKGDAIFATSTLEDDRLGEMLLKSGKIKIEHYEKSVELLKKTKKRQGTILVELGYLTPKELYDAVKDQVKEIIYSLFNLEHGDYEFVPGDLPTEEVITLKMSIGNLIYNGIKRINSWSTMKRQLPDIFIPKFSSNPMSLFQEIHFTDVDKKIISMIDGKKTVRQIIDNSWVTPLEALKTLYTLWCLDIIEDAKAESPTEFIDITFEEIFRPHHVEEDTFIKKVNELYEKIDSMNYFELLGVSDDAGVKTISKRYLEMAKEFHPDKYYNFSKDYSLKEKLTKIIKTLTEAYEVLKDPETKEQYQKSLRGKENRQLVYAQSLSKEGRYSEAIHVLREYIEKEPLSPEAWNYMALASFRLGDLESAEVAMKEAINLKPQSSQYYTNLGIIYLKMNELTKAETAFKKALQLDPSNKKASDGLKKISNFK